ncbi:MAG: hypothetical protein AB1582_07290 [Pseudomonadota bacterium]
MNAEVAADERVRMGLDVFTQAAWESDAYAFNKLRALIEAQRAFIYLVNASTTDDWRGIAIFDDRKIPVIVVNSNEEFPAARTFTFFHEYAYLLLRQSAIKTTDPGMATRYFATHLQRILDAYGGVQGAALSVGGASESIGQIRS